MTGDHTGRSHLLVTGASGFLGAAVVARAQSRGLMVTALTRADADQRDPVALAKAVARAAPDMAIDAAGVVPGPGNSDVTQNTELTRGWLQALELLPRPPRLVLAGSAAVYGAGAAKDRATRESDPMLPTNNYGRAKLTALDMAVAAFARQGRDVQTGIIFNLMGRDQPGHMVPKVFIDRALGSTTGSFDVGHSGDVRDFMDVGDAADALIAMARHGAPGDVLNIATGRPTRISEVLDIVTRILGVGWSSRQEPTDLRADHICYGDPTRLRAQTGWQPGLDLETALLRTIRAAASDPPGSPD